MFFLFSPGNFSGFLFGPKDFKEGGIVQNREYHVCAVEIPVSTDKA